jgi:hypothetical protein
MRGAPKSNSRRSKNYAELLANLREKLEPGEPAAQFLSHLNKKFLRIMLALHFSVGMEGTPG